MRIFADNKSAIVLAQIKNSYLYMTTQIRVGWISNAIPVPLNEGDTVVTNKQRIGEIVEINGDKIKVKLNTSEFAIVSKDKIHLLSECTPINVDYTSNGILYNEFVFIPKDTNLCKIMTVVGKLIFHKTGHKNKIEKILTQ